jgi:hypothetical protein
MLFVIKNIVSMLRIFNYCNFNKVDARGQLTGENIMYLYPDLYTCLVGRFQVRYSHRVHRVATAAFWREGKISPGW